MINATHSACQPSAEAAGTAIPERLIRISEVSRQTGISRSQIYRLVAEGKFPRPIRPYSNKSIAWPETTVQAWIAERIAAARGQ